MLADSDIYCTFIIKKKCVLWNSPYIMAGLESHNFKANSVYSLNLKNIICYHDNLE